MSSTVSPSVARLSRSALAASLALSGLLLVAVARPVTAATPGSVVAWGNDEQGQASVPADLTDAVAVSAGDFFSLALLANGTVVGWGADGAGQSSPPVGLGDVVGISAGGDHGLAVKSDRTVVAWGDDWAGQAAVPSGLSDVAAVAAGGNGYHSLALKSDGTVVGWGYNHFGQAAPPAGLTGVVAITAGYAHSLALLADGTVVGWGGNSSCSVTEPTECDGEDPSTPPAGLSGVVAIAAYASQSLALKSDGTVVYWGHDGSAQRVEPPAGLTGVAGIAAGANHNLALHADGTVTIWGSDFYGEGTVPSGLGPVTAIAAGGHHNLALLADDGGAGGFNFSGFERPVDGGGVLNVVKAGQAVPLKWRVLDAAGTPVTDLSAVTVRVSSLACSAGTSNDQLEETAAGKSGLQNLGSGYYQFNWKTPKTYANSCKTMRLDIGDGVEHTALFQFKK